MRIVIIEYCVHSHLETLGFFFYLNQKYGVDIDIYVWKRNVTDDWLSFFSTHVCNNSSIRILPIESIFDETISADILYINTLKILKQQNNESHLRKVINQNNFQRVIIQRHSIDSYLPNIGQKYDLCSLFPIPNHVRLMPPYHIENDRDTNLGDRLRLTVVGNIQCTNKGTLMNIKDRFDITHFWRSVGSPNGHKHQLPGIKYLVNKETYELIDYIINNTDYIFIDYNHEGRMTGILLHAIALGIPLIINKSYYELLSIPSNICVTFETYDDLLNNEKLVDQEHYDSLVLNILEYKQLLMNDSIKFYMSE